jgi:hypothetical protein
MVTRAYKEDEMPETDEIELRLREAGRGFIESHDRTAVVIREAADLGMPAEAIADVSGLSPQTVAAFLRAPAG